MTKQPIYSESEDTLPMVRSELLKALIEEELSSSWNSDDLVTEESLTELEDDFLLCDCLDTNDLAIGAEKLFSNLNECWNTIDTSEVKTSLWERFGQFVPSHKLDKLINKAQEIVDLNLSPLDQLIQCVKPLLSHWSEDDLQVFARPLVYQMRGATEFKQGSWDQLSEIDQVRLTMKIAQDALVQLQRHNSQTISKLDG